MEHVIVKTVCGLLNAKGGVLLIGVDDDGIVRGIKPDLATLGSRQNVDGYELFLRQLLENSLSAATAQTVQIRFHDLGGHQVCEVVVAASGRPVFAKPARGSGNETSEFWVRLGTPPVSCTATTWCSTRKSTGPDNSCRGPRPTRCLRGCRPLLPRGQPGAGPWQPLIDLEALGSWIR